MSCAPRDIWGTMTGGEVCSRKEFAPVAAPEDAAADAIARMEGENRPRPPVIDHGSVAGFCDAERATGPHWRSSGNSSATPTKGQRPQIRAFDLGQGEGAEAATSSRLWRFTEESDDHLKFHPLVQ